MPSARIRSRPEARTRGAGSIWVLLIRRAGLQRQLHCEHGLLVMLENQSQDLDHLAIAAWRLEHPLLRRSEGGWQFSKRRAVAQGAGLALDDRQIIPPVVNRYAL